MAPERAKEAEQALRDILGRTPETDTDRNLIEASAQIFAAYNNVASQEGTAALQTSEPAFPPIDLLNRPIQEFKDNPYFAEAITSLNKTFYEVYGQRIGLEISVPDCDWTEKEIKESMPTTEGEKVKSMVLFYPSELKGKQGLVRIGQMFTLTNWSVQEHTPIVSEERIPTDYVRIEAVINAPNTNTTEQDLVNHAQKHHLLGQDLNLYILGSRFAKLLDGRYFDQGSTWSRLPGSRYEGRVVPAYCDSDGHVGVSSSLDPGYRSPRIGGRFAGVKKA